VICRVCSFCIHARLAFWLVPYYVVGTSRRCLGRQNASQFGSVQKYGRLYGIAQLGILQSAGTGTLPLEEFRCGLAECIKHAAIADAPYFAFIRDQVVPHLPTAQEATPKTRCFRFSPFRPGSSKDSLSPEDPALLIRSLPTCPLLNAAPSDRSLQTQSLLRKHPFGCLTRSQRTDCHIATAFKMAFVEEDLHEQGARKALNFGHTFGHALAACQPTMRHGQAVACGMALAAEHAVDVGILSKQEYEELVHILTACGLEVTQPCSLRE